ncbi:hypothetical protein FACS1894201_02100 [Bacteroidia bacterium]|nr:hypothetical protein FACS1894201_02100 [Bacteroidia bacterium]
MFCIFPPGQQHQNSVKKLIFAPYMEHSIDYYMDGKKLKGVSPTSQGNSGLYILNARVGENRICVGQERDMHL